MFISVVCFVANSCSCGQKLQW